jgi:hypothetical protein
MDPQQESFYCAGRDWAPRVLDLPGASCRNKNWARLYWDPINKRFKNDDEANGMSWPTRRFPDIMSVLLPVSLNDGEKPRVRTICYSEQRHFRAWSQLAE